MRLLSFWVHWQLAVQGSEPLVGVGLVFCLADGNTMNTSSGLCHHLSSCSKSNCASDRLQRWLFMHSSNCQHTSWVGKNIFSTANVFYPTVSLDLMDITFHSRMFQEYRLKHKELAIWDIWQRCLLSSSQSEVGLYVGRRKAHKDTYTVLTFLCKISISSSGTRSLHWCDCIQVRVAATLWSN